MKKYTDTSKDSQGTHVYRAQHGSLRVPHHSIQRACHGSLVYSASSVFSTFSFQIKFPKILWPSCTFTASMRSMILHFLQKKVGIPQPGIQGLPQLGHSVSLTHHAHSSELTCLLFFSYICCLQLCTAVHVVSSAQDVVFLHMSILYPRLNLYTIFPMKHLLISLSYSENPRLLSDSLDTYFLIFLCSIFPRLPELGSWSHSSLYSSY